LEGDDLCKEATASLKKGQYQRMQAVERDAVGAAGGAHRKNGTKNPLGANSEIGRKLKQYYDELVSDEVPDRFAQLLAQLEQAEPVARKD
jgi:hypothetical protein